MPRSRVQSAPSDADAVLMSRHLLGLAMAIRRRVSDGLIERGHDLSPSSTQVVPNLPAEGIGMSDLAGRLRLTLQRTGQLVARLEEDGYVERVADPNDGRAKRVVYSPRGRTLVADIEAIMQETTEEFADTLGKQRFEDLCSELAELDAAVNGVDAPLRLGERR
ncbi:MAG: MarR family transcriptional regulator [Myxococcota bacterium]